MDDILKFYKKTWWLWLVFIIISAVLGNKVRCIFYIMIPLLIGYSFYFGLVRSGEESNK